MQDDLWFHFCTVANSANLIQCLWLCTVIQCSTLHSCHMQITWLSNICPCHNSTAESSIANSTIKILHSSIKSWCHVFVKVKPGIGGWHMHVHDPGITWTFLRHDYCRVYKCKVSEWEVYSRSVHMYTSVSCALEILIMLSRFPASSLSFTTYEDSMLEIGAQACWASSACRAIEQLHLELNSEHSQQL